MQGSALRRYIRSAVTGRFVTARFARRHPRTTVTEQQPRTCPTCGRNL